MTEPSLPVTLLALLPAGDHRARKVICYLSTGAREDFRPAATAPGSRSPPATSCATPVSWPGSPMSGDRLSATDRFCADSRRPKPSSLLKRYEPDAWLRAC